jgi:hypothetical protein
MSREYFRTWEFDAYDGPLTTDDIMNSTGSDHLTPALWQNLLAGMTSDDVQAVCPDAIENPNPDALATGAQDRLIVPEFFLNGDAYSVHLYFADQKLVQVTLSLGDDDATMSAAYGVLTLLRAKYGPELSLSEPEPDDLLQNLTADWLANNGVNICLVCYSGICLNIVYQIRLATEVSKI